MAKVTIQKNRSPKVEAKLVGSFTISKFALSKSEIELLPQCASPTAVKAIPRITIKSVRLGFRVTFAAYAVILSFNSSIELVSAFSQLSIFSFRPIPNNRNAIQILATTISTKTIAPYLSGLYLKTSNIAA